VAVCGSSTLDTNNAILVEQPGMTICCETSQCTLRNIGTDNTLDAFGAGLTLQDLTFLDGQAEVFFGGNVAIDAGGDHFILGCTFQNGSASEIGGNLFVQTTGTLTVLESSFVGGQAGEAGGGLYVLNAQAVTVRNSDFTNNSAPGGTGGGFFSVLESASSPGQDITFDGTTFSGNSASIGGGFFVTQLGQLPTLNIINTSFSSNTGKDAAGAGAIAESLDNLQLTLTDSTATGNVAGVCTDLLGFFDSSTEPVCVDGPNLTVPPSP